MGTHAAKLMSDFPKPNEWIALFVWYVLFAFQISAGFRNSSGIDTRRIYRRFYKQIPGAPPAWAFASWFVWYIFLAVGAWEGWRSTHFQQSNSTHYNVFVLLAFILAIILKFWMPVFTGALDFGGGLAIIVIAFGLLSSMLGLAAAHSVWVPVGLFVPVLLWLLFALYINIRMLTFQACASQLIKAMRVCQAKMFQPCFDEMIKNTKA